MRAIGYALLPWAILLGTLMGVRKWVAAADYGEQAS
jgi:hypothetical protein